MPPAGSSLRWSAPIKVMSTATVSITEVVCEKRCMFYHTTGILFDEKERLEPRPKIVDRNHSVQAARLSCSSCRCLAETDALTTSCFRK